ncbi:hypothetical protein U9M48_032332 [Paspalum notatum var. saurae]|uniref:Protein TIFY 9 n=1 Tax=Paspalum notatum var. saurae TaxID=547442 RepID=A0AAQ3U4V5_PASNO
MASSAPVELDFLGLRPAAAAADHHGGGNGTTTTTTTSSSSSSSSIRGMKTSAIASIGARQLRRVIAGEDSTAPAPAPSKQAPMTLFYNGAVATFDAAEAIMKMAMEVTTSNGGRVVRGNAFADMPLTRTKSLQQFLQKRKERLSGSGPYQLGLGGGTSRVGGGAGTKSFRVKEEAV